MASRQLSVVSCQWWTGSRRPSARGSADFGELSRAGASPSRVLSLPERDLSLPSRVSSLRSRCFGSVGRWVAKWCSKWGLRPHLQFLCAVAVAVLWPRAASAQVDQMPEPGYYAAVNEFYSGQYRDAERAFRRMTRSGVQANQSRWIDSICYNAMLGEVLYHQGRNAEALAVVRPGVLDAACRIRISCGG